MKKPLLAALCAFLIFVIAPAGAQVTISPPISTITINGNTYTNADWEANFQGTLAALGNDISAVASAFTSRTPSGTGTTFLTLSGSFTQGNAIVMGPNGNGIDGGPGGGGGNITGEHSATNPIVSGDVTKRFQTGLRTTYTNALPIATGFTNAQSLDVRLEADFGLNSYGGGTNAKTTFFPILLEGYYRAHGQRFLMGLKNNCWGNGDCFAHSTSVGFWGADIAGDEGQGFGSVSYLSQAGLDNNPALTLTTINGAPTSNTCNTTATQSITGSQTAQTITVASTTGCTTSTWIVVNPGRPRANPNYEAVQITGVGAGTITGVFRLNQSNGVAISPAKVVPLQDRSRFGQGRMLVNLSAAGHDAGTVTNISGGGFTGSGTGWTNTMVGDNASPNIGCIALNADTMAHAPFNGSGTNGPLRSWYAIATRDTATSLGVFSTSTAGDAAYHGYGPGGGGYLIQPCSEVLQIVGSNAILMTTAAPWLSGDLVEQAITPFPDVTAHHEHLASYTAGGALRAWYKVVNRGRRAFQAGLELTSNMAGGGETYGWESGINLFSVRRGMRIDSSEIALALGGAGSINSDINWGHYVGAARNQAIGYDEVNGAPVLMLHGVNGSGRCADQATLCLGIGSSSNYWSNLQSGKLALRPYEGSGQGGVLRFYDESSTHHDPRTATNYIDILYAYNGSDVGNFHGLRFSNGAQDLLKLDFGAGLVTTPALAVTSNQTVGGNLTVGGFVRNGIASGLTAVGTDHTNALVLTKQTNIVAVAASTAVGVELPLASAVGVGGWVDVYNDGPANSFKVYPNAVDAIDGNTESSPRTLNNGWWARYIAVDNGNYKSYPMQFTR